ncbi:MAG: hypothetical protein ACI4RJ_04415 [Alphaproteobacteria bacterium]
MNSSFFYSLLAHFFIGLFLFVSIPSWQEKKEMQESVVLWVDLNKVEISNKTNLPPKKKEVKMSQPKKEIKPPVMTPAQKKVAPPPVPKQKQVKKEDSVPVKEEKIKPEQKKQEPVKQKNTSPAVSKQPETKQQEENDLESLLTSVEKISKSEAMQKAKDKNEMSNMVDGVLDSFADSKNYNAAEKISASYIDSISSAVKEHWNRDAGIEGLETMIVVLEVKLSSAGKVLSVEMIHDKARMEKDKTYRSIADSAKRAVFICDAQDDSVFRQLARKYPASFRQWQNLKLRFNPLET